MKFIDARHEPPAAPAVADNTFEQLQSAFYTRLRKDRVRLVVLGTTLAHAGADPKSVLEDLRTFAHRLRGAAAIFDAAEIRDAAQALEVAAHVDPEGPADQGNTRVWSALTLLSDLLAWATDSSTQPGLTLLRGDQPERF
jgi:hypothetical protein